MTTYQQQVQWLTKLQQLKSSRGAILINITKEIQAWQESGNHIILLTDFKDDVESQSVLKWVATLGLVEAITFLHPTGAPPMFQWGSRPIDGIFVATQLLERAGRGYLSFGDVAPSDHRTIWLDLHLPEICPQHQEAHIKPGYNAKTHG